MVNKKFLIISLQFLINLCFGQFIYTDYEEAENWIRTNYGNNYIELDSSNIWYKYKLKKKITNKNHHHFGIFFNLQNFTNSKIIHQKSELIGNGLLTNYHFDYSKIKIVNSMFFSNKMQEARRGFVRTIKDVTMYTNQAYLKYSSNILQLSYSLKIGRDFLIEGYGMGSKLFFSDYSRPFDQLLAEAKFKNLSGKFAAINLDTLYNYNRFLYMHTFNYESNNISLSIGEAVISTGIDASIDIKYLNPFNFWAWENTGSLDKGLNAFLYFGFDFRPKKTIKFYSEILIDDINFHKKDAFYLNKYAYLIGVHKTSFPFQNSNLWIEHTNILNQVYQSYHPTHIFTHRGYPIGHYLGNDFINSRIHFSQIFETIISKAFFNLSYLRQGINNIDTIFDNPWEDNDGNEINDYVYPGHPTPPVTNILDINFGFELNIRDLTNLTIHIDNHKISKNKFKTKIRLSFWSYLNITK